MTLADLDHAISTLENSATADAVSETLEFLRGMRERAVEVVAWRHGEHAWHAASYLPGTTGDLAERPALLITPEDG